MLDRKRGKRQKDEAKSVKVELLHLTQPRGGRILHEQEYNTGHGIQATLLKYTEKYGVSRASRKYNKSRSYIYCSPPRTTAGHTYDQTLTSPQNTV